MKKLLTMMVLLPLLGCASVSNSDNESNEQLLAAAGFHLYMPKNPEEEANLKTMPQRKVVYMDKAVKPTYIYADHDECDCIYVADRRRLRNSRPCLHKSAMPMSGCIRLNTTKACMAWGACTEWVECTAWAVWVCIPWEACMAWGVWASWAAIGSRCPGRDGGSFAA